MPIAFQGWGWIVLGEPIRGLPRLTAADAMGSIAATDIDADCEGVDTALGADRNRPERRSVWL
jgi:hypothetical protein